MKIELTSGKYAIIDLCDFDLVTGIKWHAHFENGRSWYAVGRRKKSRKQIRMHRIIAGASDNEIVDHINCDTLDNRRKNLRVCTKSGNAANQRKHKVKTSIYKGVSWAKKYSHFVAKIKVNYKQIHLGCFRDEVDAAKAYNSAAIKYFGKFARLNEFV